MTEFYKTAISSPQMSIKVKIRPLATCTYMLAIRAFLFTRTNSSSLLR